jgi:hypothetical protein
MSGVINSLNRVQHNQAEQQREENKIVFVGKYATFVRGNGDLITDEITTYIFGFLPADTLALVRRICHQWNTIASDDCLWKRFAHVDGLLKSPEDRDSYAVFYQKCIRKEDALINSIILNLKKEKALDDRKSAELEKGADEDILSKINEEISQFKAEKETSINELKRESLGISCFSKAEKRDVQLKFLDRIAEDFYEYRADSLRYFEKSNLKNQFLFVTVAQSGALDFLKELVQKAKATFPTERMMKSSGMDLIRRVILTCDFKTLEYLVELGMEIRGEHFLVALSQYKSSGKTILDMLTIERLTVFTILCKGVKKDKLPQDWNAIKNSVNSEALYLERDLRLEARDSLKSIRKLLRSNNEELSKVKRELKQIQDRVTEEGTKSFEDKKIQLGILRDKRKQANNSKRFLDERIAKYEEILPGDFMGAMRAVGLFESKS